MSGLATFIVNRLGAALGWCGVRLLALMLAMGALFAAQAQEAPVVPLPQPVELTQPIQLAQFNIFEELFGPQNRRPQRTRPQRPSRDANGQQRQQQAAPVRARVASVKLTPKAEDAVRILVVGDSMALDLSRALDRLYKEDTNIQIIGRSVGSSGLVRPDFFNWPKFISEQLEKEKVDLAIVNIGINDRQDLRTRDPQTNKRVRFKTLTDDWQKLYRTRVGEIHDAFAAKKVPVIWVGLPPMRAKSYSGAISQITALQQAVTLSQNGRYVDIWERFLTAEGAYTRFGATLEGQRVQMRKSNGIHFTKKGADKVALFVDRQIKQIYKGGTISVAIADPLEGTDAQFMLRPPFQSLGGGVRIEFAGPRISLNAPPVDSGGLKKVNVAVLKEKKPEITLADLEEAPQGRADDFVWVRETEKVAATPIPLQPPLDVSQASQASLAATGG